VINILTTTEVCVASHPQFLLCMRYVDAVVLPFDFFNVATFQNVTVLGRTFTSNLEIVSRDLFNRSSVMTHFVSRLRVLILTFGIVTAE